MGTTFVNILLVDDEDTDLTAIRDALESEGYSVTTAPNIPEALAAYESSPRPIDLLIADISLPVGNGCDLAITLSKKQPGLRVLFISGHVGAEVCRYYGLDVSDLNFLRKPFASPLLKERVRQVLASGEPFLGMKFPKTSSASGGPEF